MLVAAPLAAAGTGDALKEGKRNGTTVKETEISGNQNAKSGKGGYVTRQSNIRSGAKAGGAAVYGCRPPVRAADAHSRAGRDPDPAIPIAMRSRALGVWKRRAL